MTMKREIKFRGKRADNGEWVYGSLVNNTQRVISDSLPAIIYEGSDGRDACEVTVESVGQYTGINDKNKKPIYEGDILHYTRKRVGEEDEEYYREVTFHSGCFCMYVPNHFVHSGLYNHIVNGILDWEVIGNKFDNPEMLK